MTKFERILINAKQLIIDHGWCQRTFVTDAFQHCIAGAILYIAATSFVDENNQCLSDEVIEYLLNILKKEGEKFEYLDQWNDAPGRTKEEVINLLDKAINLLK